MGKKCNACGGYDSGYFHRATCGTKSDREAITKAKNAAIKAAEEAQRELEIQQANAAAERRRRKNEARKRRK